MQIYFQQYEEVTKKNLLSFKGYLIEKYKPKTVNLRIQAINKYLEFVGKDKLKLNAIKLQQKTFLENVISDCDAIGVDWFDSIADIDESSPLLEDCVDRHGWLEGIKQYYLKKVSEDE